MKNTYTKESFLKLSLTTLFIASSAVAIADGEGKKTYDEACGVCHNAGVANAPKLGDKAAWAPRITTGIDAIYKVAIEGRGAMPAKGGRADISDDAVKAAVDYMIEQSK